MQVKRIAECCKREHSAILSTFIKLPVVIKIFVLSNFEWPFYTGFTVLEYRGASLKMKSALKSNEKSVLGFISPCYFFL